MIDNAFKIKHPIISSSFIQQEGLMIGIKKPSNALNLHLKYGILMAIAVA